MPNKILLHEFSFGLLPMAAILGISSALILFQPDLSAAATIFLIGGLMFFMAGGEMRQIIPSLIVALVVGMLLILVYSTGQERISSFIEGIQDPKLASYHVVRSFEAIVRGGAFGVGIGRANTKFTGLPVAPTDSIFAVIAEETGILGAMIVIILFIIFLWRGLTIARNAPDMLGRLLASGITVWIFIEAVINMSVLVNLLPFAGNALPFISYGGSNLTMVLVGVGIIMSVARQTSIKNNEEERRPLNAVVSVRRDDGRRSVSRARRSANGERIGPMTCCGSAARAAWKPDLLKNQNLRFETIPAAGLHGVGLLSLPGNIRQLDQGLAARLERSSVNSNRMSCSLRAATWVCRSLMPDGRSPQSFSCPISSRDWP